jgi:uncharacterized protein YbcI
MAIANLVVRLMSEYTGRGTTKARAYLNDDFISVVLHDLLTKGERSLVRDGKVDLVLAARRAYQQTMSQDLTEGIEQITGRKVMAFLSDNHIEPDVAVESFILEPREDVSNDGLRGSDGDGRVPLDE